MAADLDFNQITVRQLAFDDDLSAFKFDQEDRLGCDDFIHKEDEGKLFPKTKTGNNLSLFVP
ncbi:MAG: hypothetical protein NWE93_02870 [Candidatus Bathyarchaeota archaeon]|nr:hypothetical protein [Candidatus Bathyarchaeota archaeon]